MGKVFVGDRVSDLDTNAPPARISRVNLLVDSEHMYTAGNDSGRTIEKTCLWASQAMAERILARVREVDYRPFSAADAMLDPAAELGDGVTVGGVYSVLAREAVTFDGIYSSDIAAPGGDEVEDEYPYKSRARRQSDRELARIRSQILKTAESITLKVEAVDGRVASIRTYVDNITLEVANGAESSQITLKSGSVTIASKTIQMNGLVTFTGLANGTTTINGGCIRTGIIDAQYLNLTGAIRFGDLSADVRNEINDAWSMAEDAQSAVNDLDSTVGGWCYRGTTYIDGEQIMAGTVKASQLLGGTVGLLDYRENLVGSISISGTSTGYGLEFSTSYGGIRLNPGGNFWVDAAYGSFGINDLGVMCGADLIPLASSRYTLGSSRFPWTDVYADNGTIQMSDREKKEDISSSLDAYSAFFDALRPVRYRLKDGQSGRTHLGLIAQDVEAALEELGISTKDFAGLIKSPRENGGYDYALRYGEFIPLLIREVQELKRRLAS